MSTPPPITWEKVTPKTSFRPPRRSGHTLTSAEEYLFLFGGCIYDDGFERGESKARTSNSLFTFNVDTNEWKQPKIGSSELPAPRWHHSCTRFDNKLVVFGGFQDDAKRLNDVWVLDTRAYKWSQPIKLKSESEISPDTTLRNRLGPSPLPRGEHAAAKVGKKLYVFGGYGGQGFARRDFNDMYALDTETWSWERIEYAKAVVDEDDDDEEEEGLNPEPLARAGHKMDAIGDSKLVIHGGWSNKEQFNDIWIFDVKTRRWEELVWEEEAPSGPARWSHGAVVIDAIPDPQLYIWGGLTGALTTGKKPSGTYMNDTRLYNLSNQSWKELPFQKKLRGRCDTPLTYRRKSGNFYVFGGWSNKWYNDLWKADMNSIIGPPYHVTSVEPTYGSIKGGTKITLTGVDFPNTRNIKVQFDAGDAYQNEETFGSYVSANQIQCETPNLENFINKNGRVCNISVSLDGEIFTIYPVEFEFFTVTSANHSVIFGPALLDGIPTGQRSEFTILTRDRFGEVRKYGGDKFKVLVERVIPQAELEAEAQEGGEENENDEDNDDSASESDDDDEEDEDAKVGEIEEEVERTQEIPVTLEDNENGCHTVSFNPELTGEYRITASYLGTFGGTEGQLSDMITVRVVDGASFEDGYGLMGGDAYRNVLNSMIKGFSQKIKGYEIILDRQVEEGDVKSLLDCKSTIFAVQTGQAEMLKLFEQCKMAVHYLDSRGNDMASESKYISQSESLWKTLTSRAPEKAKEIKTAEKATGKHVQGELDTYIREAKDYRYNFGTTPDFWRWDITYAEACQAIEKYEAAHKMKINEFTRWYELSVVFDMESQLTQTKKAMSFIDNTLLAIRDLWSVINKIRIEYEDVCEELWDELDPDVMEAQSKRMVKMVRKMPRDVRGHDAFDGVSDLAKNYMTVVPLVAAILHPSMRPRHWDQMRAAAKKNFEDPLQNPKQKLRNIMELGMHEFAGEVEDISDQALKEEKMEKQLAILKENWACVEWVEEKYQEGLDIYLLRVGEDDFEMLENDQLTVQGMMGSRFLSTFETEVTTWQRELAGVSENSNLISEVQRLWSYLEPLFIGSEEVKKELAEDAARFVQIDIDVKQILKDARATKSIIRAANKEGLFEKLEETEKGLNACKRSLMDFLDQKRTQFPRFYFTSEADLLDILSNGNVPSKIAHHVTKVYLKVKAWQIDQRSAKDRPWVPRFFSTVGGEKVTLNKEVQLLGKPEVYLQTFLDAMTQTLKEKFHECWKYSQELSRVDWLMEQVPDPLEKNETHADPRSPAQLTLLCSFIQYVLDCEQAISSGKLKQFNQVQRKQISDLVNITINPKLTKNERQRVMCMITMDAHNRDIVAKLIREEVDRVDHFLWQSQLKPRRDPNNDNLPTYTVLNGFFPYGFEYIGNDGRLVVTPLTDRIYVTSTVGLYLKMGVAPAGPAGTGKTETVKDLSMNFGYTIYVFNCSPEMDYISMGNVFKGLGATGSWGCFDEFNRLRVEVLSVVTVQFKALCDGLKADQHKVTIEGDTVALVHSVGVFITMNPGYIGRAELPEGLKALFRPMTVMVPDLVLICENMLMAEGFQEATALASKFYGLYSLLNDLLSKQLHYDWGLRAVKSVLRVAGGFKRQEPDVDEQIILCRALRDFNTPKIVAQDWVIFFGLLGDLFPGIDPPRKRDMALEDCVAQACDEKGLWKDEYFQRKCVELSELLAIRHCVFVMGPPAAGKSETWRTLAKAQTIGGQKTKVQDINPKAITPQELYGYITLATREWKDGLLSKVMRDMGNENDENPKWIIMDGDLDTNWIESMNSVMDMNKTLTLASNERIPLKPHMKMMFEIRDLRFASLATVSRAGVLYISTDGGEQWKALISSWVENKGKLGASGAVQNVFHSLFKDYCADTLHFLKAECKSIVPLEDMAYIMSLLYMLDTMINEEYLETLAKLDSESEIRTIVEPRFVFAAVWSFGASMFEFEGTDYSEKFSKWWMGKFKSVRLPTRGSVFDLYLDIENEEGDTFVPWSQSKYFYSVKYKAGTPMDSITIPTPESSSNAHWLVSLMHMSKPVMLVGPAGCGKTQLVSGLLKQEDEAIRKHANINFNFYTSSQALQDTIQSKIVKRVGSNYGPAGKAKMVFFVDDFNLPEVDIYDTQSAVALMRQVIEYQRWFDRVKLGPMNIQDCQYIAAMNPTAGSFYLNPRLQRHFVTMAMDLPGATSLLTIFTTYLDGHLHKFNDEIKGIAPNIIQGALEVHNIVINSFRKSAVNFHYEFNLRHLQNVFQGLLMSTPKVFKDPSKFVQLWCHESERVYSDRLVNETHIAKFSEIIKTCAKKKFSAFNADISALYADKDPKPLIFTPFAKGTSDLSYNQAKSMKKLTNICNKTLESYNESNAAMNLVLFEDAVKHVCRISRIISSASGHCLSVGVGGSGKRSLARLAAFSLAYGLKTITINQTYGISDLKEDLQKFYKDAGVKDLGTLFLFTDSQITNERFLVYINDLLASGNIPDLYQQEEKDEIINECTKAAKESGLVPEPEIVWEFFMSRIRKNLHVCLCFSPVGESFRSRALKFPALINSTVIDWFQPWPQKALLGVAEEFLAEEELGEPYMKKAIVSFMPYAFQNVNDIAQDFLEVEKRSVYTTPKSFLECIKLYKTLLEKKREQAMKSIERLENGCLKLNQTAASVQKLSDDLAVMLAAAEVKKNNSEAIAAKVAIEKDSAQEETAKADMEKQKADEIEADVTRRQAAAKEVMDKAQPAVDAAMAALDTLNKKDLGEAKTMNKAPEGVAPVFAAVAQLLCGMPGASNPDIAAISENIVVKKSGAVKDESWAASKKACLTDIAGFLRALLAYKECIENNETPAANFKHIRKYIAAEGFDAEVIRVKNSAAAGLCAWVQNIVIYRDIHVEVEPLRIELAECNDRLAVARESLKNAKERLDKLQELLDKLKEESDQAEADKAEAIAQVERGEAKLDLAKRLTRALDSEGGRWMANIKVLESDYELLTGDVLLASAFISYIGPFTKEFREHLLANCWTPFMQTAAKPFIEVLTEDELKDLQEKFEEKLAKENEENPNSNEEDNNSKFELAPSIPMTPTADPLKILTFDAEVAKWQSQNLPSDKVSTENATIVTNTDRWPVLIDPQLQAIAWIREKEKDNNLDIVRLEEKQMLRKLERAMENGESLMLENLKESIPAILNPVISRATVKKGRKFYVRLGDSEVELGPKFKLFLHTKLSNPHFPPEIQAECALINFTVTPSGLADQLLNLVVKMERPDLADQRLFLIKQQNQFKVRMAELEDSILHKIATAEGDITEDRALIEGLENTKEIANDIERKQKIAAKTAESINITSEKYRLVAARGSLLFFLLNSLFKMHTYYIYNLEAFIQVMRRSITACGEPDDILKPKAEPLSPVEEAPDVTDEGEEGDGQENGEEQIDQRAIDRAIKSRCKQLIQEIQMQVFNYMRRGLFESDKLVISTLLTLKVMIAENDLNPRMGAALVKQVTSDDMEIPESLLEIMDERTFKGVAGLEMAFPKLFGGFSEILSDMQEDYAKWLNLEQPETKPIPGYKDSSEFCKLLLLKLLRPDRLVTALKQFVSEQLGEEYVTQRPFDMMKAFSESDSRSPIFFALFPGVDPTTWVEGIGNELGYTLEKGNFVNISMGEGQEPIASAALEKLTADGGWIFLQNLHLMEHWTPTLERILDEYFASETLHKDFRVFLSAEPPVFSFLKNMPEFLMMRAIKVCNESPSDIKSNIRATWAEFNQERVESNKQSTNFRGCLATLCFYHSIILGRRRFGQQGWSRGYSFNLGDLNCCANVLEDYLNEQNIIPWDDFRYIFGQIMYGGHITDSWDRRTNETYLDFYYEDGIFKHKEIAPGFKAPDVHKLNYDGVLEYVEKKLPQETPLMFQMHPNVEIGYLTNTQAKIWSDIVVLGGLGGTKAGIKKEEGISVGVNVESVIEDFLGRIPNNYNMIKIMVNVKPLLEQTEGPFSLLLVQELTRMNVLLSYIRKSLVDLQKGLNGELNMSDAMDDLQEALSIEQVPGRNPFHKTSWEKLAWWSKKPLGGWFSEMLKRNVQLDNWVKALVLPTCTWFSGLFNPMAFLTAVMQVTGRRQGYPLDQMTTESHVSMITDIEKANSYPPDGAYVHGIFLEGARWGAYYDEDEGDGDQDTYEVAGVPCGGHLCDSKLKDLLPMLPVIYFKAVVVRDTWEPTNVGYMRHNPTIYDTPLYMTTFRGPTYTSLCTLKSVDPTWKWTLAGVAMILQEDE